MDRDAGAQLAQVFDLLGPLYRRATRHVERGPAGPGMPVGVRAVLDLLRAHGPMTVPDMARSLALSRQFLQRAVDDAAARSWVAARDNPAHRRSRLIDLTAPGRTTIEATRREEQVVLARVAEVVDERDVDGCLRVLRALSVHLAGDDQRPGHDETNCSNITS